MTPSTPFADLGLSQPLLKALKDLGYEAPSPVQQESIPVLLEGRDILAQAQTGTGKTAAFALPILNQLDVKKKHTQALILAPTRELAIQVAEAFQSYAKHLTGFHILPIYGGQDFRPQLRALERGVHVVVGTPGRVADHIRRGTLKLNQVNTVVLDEADEMLKMGFIDEVKSILDKTPDSRQTALFSATMPGSIQGVAKQYLQDAEKIQIKSKTKTVSSIAQSAMLVTREHKLEVLTRYLEVEDFDGIIIFTRTKLMSSELAEKLVARGYAASAINGDMKQSVREAAVNRLKNGKMDIVVATDVAARGIDVERVSHVINYDIPYDEESYVHRIGRTGRAGREGKALLFVTPKERRMLRDIERSTRQPIELVEIPGIEQLTKKRTERFAQRVEGTMANRDLSVYREAVEKIIHDNEHSALDVAAALACLLQKKQPLKNKSDDELQAALAKESQSGGRGKPGGRSNRRKPSSGRGGYGKPSFGKKPEFSRDKPKKKFTGKPKGRKPNGGKPTGGQPTGGRPTGGNSAGRKRTAG